MKWLAVFGALCPAHLKKVIRKISRSRCLSRDLPYEKQCLIRTPITEDEFIFGLTRVIESYARRIEQGEVAHDCEAIWSGGTPCQNNAKAQVNGIWLCSVHLDNRHWRSGHERHRNKIAERIAAEIAEAN